VPFTSIIYSREADDGSFIRIFTDQALSMMFSTSYTVAVDGPPCLFQSLLTSHSNTYCEGKMSIKDTSPGLSFQPTFPCTQNLSTRNLSLQRVQYLAYRTRGPDEAPNMPKHKGLQSSQPDLTMSARPSDPQHLHPPVSSVWSDALSVW